MFYRNLKRISKNKIIITVLLFFILIAGGVICYESQYFNKYTFISPIDFEGDIPIRKDAYGSGEFGTRRNGRRVHNGLDILADVGIPVKAMLSGRVINAEEKKGLGKYVEILHRNNFISIYAHLSEILVEKGKRVRQGQLIGKVGKTGNANYKRMQPHLHFEIRKEGLPIDPKKYWEFDP